MSAQIEKGNFEIYLEKYCEDRGISAEEALTHRLIRDIKEYYENAI